MAKESHYLTKTELARNRIQQMILAGEIEPGDRLTSREISAKLKISETPVREAIRALVAEGWLELQNHVGAVVQNLHTDQIREISALRGLVCGLAIELAAANFDDERLARIDETIDVAERALASGDMTLYGEKNAEFHELLCDNPQSRWCQRILHNLLGLMSPRRHRMTLSDARLRESLEEHKRIRDHLRAGDFRAAAEQVRGHEANTGNMLIRLASGMEP